MNLIEHPPKKILLINTFGIGDVLFTTPVIRNLKAQFPNIEIAYLGNRRTAPLLQNHPLLTKVFSYERDEFNEIYKRSKIEYCRELRKFLDAIKQENFDTVFDFSLNSSVSFLTWMAQIPRRIGLNYKNRSRFLTHPVPFYGFEGKHVVEHYLDFLKTVGVTVRHRELEIGISPEDMRWAEDFCRQHGVRGDKPLIGVSAGGGVSWGVGAKFRRWSAEKYRNLLDKMIEKLSAEIILFGDKSETEIYQQVSSGSSSRIIHAFGKTTLGQLAALMKKCQVIVLNDGGPLHIAVAVKTKTVSIFGPVDEKVYGPFGPEAMHRVVAKGIMCRPCYRLFRMTSCEHISCLQQISVDDVFQEVQAILN